MKYGEDLKKWLLITFLTVVMLVFFATYVVKFKPFEREFGTKSVIFPIGNGVQTAKPDGKTQKKPVITWLKNLPCEL